MRAVFPFLAVFSLGHLAAADVPSGFEAGLSVTLEASAGLSGGAQRGEALQALTLAHASWQNAPAHSDAAALHAYASVLNHEGNGPTERFLGDFLAASNIEAYDSTRLYAWWIEVGQAGWSARAGALLADEEFAGSEAGGQLVNSAFGWPAFISANTVNTGPAFYVAAPGVRLSFALAPNLTWRVGVYDGDTFDSSVGDPAVNRHGLHYRLGGAQGWFTISELAYNPADDATRLKLGVWHHTAAFADQYFDAVGEPFATSGRAPHQHSGNSGAYVTVERTLAGESGKPRRVDFFARLGGAPSDRNTLSWALDTGVAWSGPFAARPDDVLAVGFAHAEFSPRFAATARLLDPAAPKFDAEQVFEASYTFALSDHFSCKPDVQYLRNPGGSRAQRNALLVMFRLTADF